MGAFGKASLERLATCDGLLQQVANKAIKTCPVDFGIAEGNRTTERQLQLFAEGKTKVDGVNDLSKHNYYPSKAFDIFAFVNGKMSYDVAHLCFIAEYIMAAAAELGVKLRWGGNWDSDGEILTDQNFDDLPHFELVD